MLSLSLSLISNLILNANIFMQTKRKAHFFTVYVPIHLSIWENNTCNVLKTVFFLCKLTYRITPIFHWTSVSILLLFWESKTCRISWWLNSQTSILTLQLYIMTTLCITYSGFWGISLQVYHFIKHSLASLRC